MNKLIYVFIALPLFYNCGGEPKEEPEEIIEEVLEETSEVIEEPEVINSFIIKSGEVGVFTMGSPVPKMPEGLKVRQGTSIETYDGESTTFEVSMVFNNLEDVVDLKLEDSGQEHYEDKNIIEMIVHSNYYLTEEGISVGSTIQEFIDVYGDYTLSYIPESNVFALESESYPLVQFRLNEHDYSKSVKPGNNVQELNPDDFIEGARIKTINVY